jgi:hypothetical protein
MNDRSNKPSPETQLEASTEFARRSIKVRAGFRTGEAEVLAGGILEVEFFVEHKGGKAFYLAVGGSRLKLRPAFFDFSATLEGAEAEMDDPAAKIPDLGGPVGTIPVEPSTSYRQMILVNEFVRLERLNAFLAEGETAVLRLRCQRSLPLADAPEKALKLGPGSPKVEAELIIKVRRDDAALELLIKRLANQVLDDRSAIASAEREAAIAKLSALRSPLAVPYLRTLRDHPDTAVQMYAQRALALLNQDD